MLCIFSLCSFLLVVKRMKLPFDETLLHERFVLFPLIKIISPFLLILFLFVRLEMSNKKRNFFIFVSK